MGTAAFGFAPLNLLVLVLLSGLLLLVDWPTPWRGQVAVKGSAKAPRPRHTVLYRLKTHAQRVEEALTFLTEGVDVSVLEQVWVIGEGTLFLCPDRTLWSLDITRRGPQTGLADCDGLHLWAGEEAPAPTAGESRTGDALGWV